MSSIERACAVGEQAVVLCGWREEIEDERQAGRTAFLRQRNPLARSSSKYGSRSPRSIGSTHGLHRGDGERQAQIDVRASDVRVGGFWDKQRRNKATDDDQMFRGHAPEEMEEACRLTYQCARWMFDLVGHVVPFDPHRSRKTPTRPLPGLEVQVQHDSARRSCHASICIGTRVTAGQVLRVGDQREVRPRSVRNPPSA